MFHALPQGLNLFLWRHTHQTQTHRMFMQFPKYKLQLTKETTFKNTK